MKEQFSPEEQTKNNLDSTILRESVLMYLNTTVAIFLSQTIKFCFKSLFVSNVMLLLSNYNSNLKIKDIEKDTAALEELSLFTKKILKIQKRIAPFLLTLNIAITSMSGFYILRKELISTHVTKKNPFTNQQIDSHTDQTKTDLLIEGIKNNILLTKEEKRHIQKLHKYFEENPYLDYETTYYNFATSDIFYPVLFSKKEDQILAEYFRDINIIQVYDKEAKEVSLPHEAVHQTGFLKTRFLNEGLTSIIVSEYCYDGMIVDGYKTEIYLTEIMIEFIGKDIILEAFSKQDETLIINQLAKKLSMEEIQTLLMNFEEYSIAKRKYENLEIHYDDFMNQFLMTGNILIQTLENSDLEEEKQQYIYYCYVCSSSAVFSMTTIPKFHFNSEKIQDYPKLDADFKTILNCLLTDASINKQIHPR